MTDDNANHLVPQVIGGQIEQSGDEVKNVTITTMSQATVQGSNMARGTALIALDKIYSSRNSHQARTEHWLVNVTYYLNSKQVSDQAKVFPQFETINPLVLTITEFHENRLSVDPDCSCYKLRCVGDSGTAHRRSNAVSFQLILPFFPEELRELLLDPSISAVIQQRMIQTPQPPDRAHERSAVLPGRRFRLQPFLADCYGYWKSAAPSDAAPSSL
jgi:hypothetical protein